jgi:hypothetical protein
MMAQRSLQYPFVSHRVRGVCCKLLKAASERCQQIGLRWFAAQATADRANLTHVLSGRRKPSQLMLAKLETALARFS